MKVIHSNIEGPLVIEPTLFEDERGYFLEAFNQRLFQEITNQDIEFVQDNQSRSKKGVIRGLHYQIKNSQGKLVRVVNGSIFDVFVDIRRSSPTFGQWDSVFISSRNKKQVWIPKGFAHGFMALAENTEVIYKTTDYYDPQHERCIRWDDGHLLIDWPLDTDTFVSVRDNMGVDFDKADTFQ